MTELLYYKMNDSVTAFSTTRQGGYSTDTYSDFNINRYCGDSETAIIKNRQLLCQTLGINDKRLIMPHQVHKTEIAVIDTEFLSRIDNEQVSSAPDASSIGHLEGYDALMTDLKGVCIGVSTADCIPVLLYDPKCEIVCAVHAGWRGTVARITEKAVAQMAATFGCRPTDLIAQIGPGISLESFEVGNEVYEAFAKAGFDMQAIARRFEKWHIDLPECNRLQLLHAGLNTDNIHDCGICTYKEYYRFFSARRLGIQSGRIFTGIMMPTKQMG